ncbi:hypothetical protein [Nonomuraea recticatena]|uniref:hypothetical protein n=1 Tax=Nonomuraea recticatena TaxID=46178 RepID=UPI00361A8733
MTPSVSARSRSSEPTRRSSDAPTGSSTSEADLVTACSPGSCGPSGHCGSGSSGSQAKRQPASTSTAGSWAASALTMVDLAVPFSPLTSTPPTRGETALSTSASLRSSSPTTALKG